MPCNRELDEYLKEAPVIARYSTYTSGLPAIKRTLFHSLSDIAPYNLAMALTIFLEHVYYY